ncbi:MAG: metallophosphoesterase family protein [bacterium]
MGFRIAQISDIHCGDARFSEKILKHFISKINSFEPDLVVIAGDLTADGYKEQFEAAKKYIDLIKCSEKMIITGNHDCRNVGYEHFENIFGQRFDQKTFEINDKGEPDRRLSIMTVDSSQPDMNEGAVGRDKYKYIDSFFGGKDKEKDLKILVLHHHLIAIPGTGRERNVVDDAGDLLKKITDLGINVVLSGHKHVPYIWKLNNTHLISSGTGGTMRIRGSVMPSINLFEMNKDNIDYNRLYSDGIEESEILKL